MNVVELNLVATPYDGGGAGQFGYLTTVVSDKFISTKYNVNWRNCREEFMNGIYGGNNWKLPLGGFLFKMAQDRFIEDIDEFISKFEALLEVGRRKPIQRSTICPIDTKGVINKASEKDILWVTPGPFWFRQPMRMSLFTMLMRSANTYTKGGDFFSSLFVKYNLAASCKGSLAKVLDGYTWYKGKKTGLTDGWYSAFSGENGLAELIRPKEKEKKPKKEEAPKAEIEAIGPVENDVIIEDQYDSIPTSMNSYRDSIVLPSVPPSIRAE